MHIEGIDDSNYWVKDPIDFRGFIDVKQRRNFIG